MVNANMWFRCFNRCHALGSLFRTGWFFCFRCLDIHPFLGQGQKPVRISRDFEREASFQLKKWSDELELPVRREFMAEDTRDPWHAISDGVSLSTSFPGEASTGGLPAGQWVWRVEW